MGNWGVTESLSKKEKKNEKKQQIQPELAYFYRSVQNLFPARIGPNYWNYQKFLSETL